MAAPIVEGIDNEVLFVFSVLVAFVTVVLVHVVYKSINNRSTRQNETNIFPDSDSTRSSRPEDQTQENSREAQGGKSNF